MCVLCRGAARFRRPHMRVKHGRNQRQYLGAKVPGRNRALRDPLFDPTTFCFAFAVCVCACVTDLHSSMLTCARAPEKTKRLQKKPVLWKPRLFLPAPDRAFLYGSSLLWRDLVRLSRCYCASCQTVAEHAKHALNEHFRKRDSRTRTRKRKPQPAQEFERSYFIER